MQWIRLITATVMLSLPFALQDAAALSIDDRSGNNSDGSARFSDPDEQDNRLGVHYGFSGNSVPAGQGGLFISPGQPAGTSSQMLQPCNGAQPCLSGQRWR